MALFKYPGAHEIESLENEINRIIIDEGHFTESQYLFQIKPNFSTLGFIVHISPEGPKISFRFDDSITDISAFKLNLIHEEYNLSDYPVDILSFNKKFLECDIGQGMFFKRKRSSILHNFTMDVDSGYKYIEKLRGGVQGYMMESKNFISTICFITKNENNELVSFNGQSITFRLSPKEI